MSPEKEKSSDGPEAGDQNPTDGADAAATTGQKGAEGSATARLQEGKDHPRPNPQETSAASAENSPQDREEATSSPDFAGSNSTSDVGGHAKKDIQKPPNDPFTEKDQTCAKGPTAKEVRPPLPRLAPKSVLGSSTATPKTTATPASTVAAAMRLHQGTLAGTMNTGKQPIAPKPSVQGGTFAEGGDAHPIVIQDNSCINALLSLGRDLRGSSGGGDGRPQVVPILPMMPSNDHRKKRQKMGGAMDMPGNEKSLLPDFWYWLPPDDKVGEWDVLCGRGGESNNYIGNKKYRKVVNARKEAYRTIPLKQRKAKTAFVKSIVQHVNNCGGRFVDLDEASGRYYVVTMEKARKKTSQALRETKELKWLETEQREKKTLINKDTVCPFCRLPGHKTKIAKACKLHHEWLDANAGKAASTRGDKVENGGDGGHDRKDGPAQSERGQPDGLSSQPSKEETRDDKSSEASSSAANGSKPPSTKLSDQKETCNGDVKKAGDVIASESSAAAVAV
jgi:hypothetical protein